MSIFSQYTLINYKLFLASQQSEIINRYDVLNS